MEFEHCNICGKASQSNLTLDCQHHICLACLNHTIKRQQQEESLRDDITLTCNRCNYETQISVPLAYKLVRQVREKRHYNSHLVCFGCMDQCFPMQDYLRGKHARHQVLSIQSALPRIQDLLYFQEKQLDETINRMFSECDKLHHYKSILTEVYHSNIIKVKMAFQNLKAEIQRKQISVLDDYEVIITERIREIDVDITENREKIEKCKHHLRWFQEHNISKEVKDQEKSLETINYLFSHQKDIEQLTMSNLQGNIVSIIEQINKERISIDLKQINETLRCVRELELFSPTDSTIDRTSSLDEQYFQVKRKQVLSSRIFPDRPEYFIQNQKSPKSWLPNEKDKPVRKIASLKGKLFQIKT